MGKAGTKPGFQKAFAGAGTAEYGLQVASLPSFTLALVRRLARSNVVLEKRWQVLPKWKDS